MDMPFIRRLKFVFVLYHSIHEFNHRFFWELPKCIEKVVVEFAMDGLGIWLTIKCMNPDLVFGYYSHFIEIS